MTLRSRWTAAVALAIAWLMAGVSARAQSETASRSIPPLRAALPAAVEVDYEAGRQKLAEHDFVGALSRFTSAYRQVPDPRLLANMALCEQRLQHCAIATSLFDRALATGEALFSSAQLSEIRGLVDACRSHVGLVKIRVSEAGAAIYVDDLEAGQSPLVSEVLVDEGAHRVRVTKAGYVPLVETVSVAHGARAAVDAVLEPTTRLGALSVRAGPNDEIAIDDQFVAKGSVETRLASGIHTVTMTSDGKRPYRTRVRIEEGQTRALDVTLEPNRRVPTWLWATGGAVLAASLVVGIASVFHSSNPGP
ncbi:MAG: PEGA domain-containing protein [Polyangiaceae bacterium]